MDNNTGVLSIERGERKPRGVRHLKRLDDSVTPERLQWLWDHIQLCDESFDDFARNKVEWFATQLQNPSVEFYEAGDDGLIILYGVLERGTCDIHYMTWNRENGPRWQRAVALELFDYLFFERKVHHALGAIPENNQVASRFAMSVGMKFEGEIRENFLFHGKYYATHIYGLLDYEYELVRRRLCPQE